MISDSAVSTKSGGITDIPTDEKTLLEIENVVCSHGDTVHYADNPQFFETCDGSYLYDKDNTPFLDLQMWYSAVNLGYANKRVNDALHKQIDKLPQLACQYLHKEKVQLADIIVKGIKRNFGETGRVHFNVGGAKRLKMHSNWFVRQLVRAA